MVIIYTLLIAASILLVIGLYNVAGYVIVLPSGNTKSYMRFLFGKKSFKAKLREVFIHPMARGLESVIALNDYKKKRMEIEMQRIDLDKTPEQFISECLAGPLLLGAMSLVFIPMGIPLITILLIVLAVVVFSKSSQTVRKQIDKLNREIEMELPRMVETLNYSLEDNNDLLKFFERYRRVAGPAMARALDRLLINLKTGNAEQALRDFDKSLGIPQVSAFVSTLLGVTYGIDQRTVLIVMEKDLRTRQRELMQREIDKRPGKIRLASVILTLMMVLLMMAPLVVMIIDEFQTSGLAGGL